jgi:putative ABC transport system ATP-binding protein
MNERPMIEVRGLRKIYRVGDVDVHALRGVDLTVRRGEFLCVVGPSGSGKSTLFHILGGLTGATSGQVIVNGRDLAKISDAERTQMRKCTVGFVFQKYNLLPTLTAADNIAIARYLAGNGGGGEPEFREILDLLGITNRLRHKPRALSGGEQQRVAIARAIVNHPAILLADEPTGNLDSKNSEAVLAVLGDLNERLGQTILMITHDLHVASFGHRIVHMLDGRILEEEGAGSA